MYCLFRLNDDPLWREEGGAHLREFFIYIFLFWRFFKSKIAKKNNHLGDFASNDVLNFADHVENYYYLGICMYVR